MAGLVKKEADKTKRIEGIDFETNFTTRDRKTSVSLKFMVFRSGLACQVVTTGVEGVRVRGPLELRRVSSCFF